MGEGSQFTTCVCVCVAAWNELQQQVKINFYTVSRNSVRYSIIRNVL